MTPFNWFNRQFNQPQPGQSAESPSQAEVNSEAATEETGEEAKETAIDQDALSWAKAAYANIQKQKAVEEPAEPTLPLEGAVRQVESVAEETSVVEAGVKVIVENITAETAEAIAEPAEPTEPIESIDETTAPEVAPLPFWAQAEAERLERLERLKAESIAEPEPVVPAVIAASLDTSSTIPDFVLDEAFLWSAEVLASQGRRPDQVSIEEITWLKQLRQGLDKTRRNLVNQLKSIVGQGPLNQDAVMEIESLLLQADVGVEATDFIVESLQNRLREEVLPPAEAIAYLKQLLREMLDKPLGNAHALTFVPEKDTLNIWLITGVNGAGKTTTIGKIVHIAQKSGYRCLIAAADTFRAAAVQQVQVWGDRSNVEVIANPGKNTDPAAVVFDAIAAAQSRGTELLIVDTAGRLQNKKNLMDELSKIRRIIDKKAPGAHVESLLVLDSTLGQNGLRQAEVFSEAAQLSGVVLTKLDGTAKGGIALAVVQQLNLPIRFIGAGEGIEDLRPFSSYEFVEALLNG
ncbi:MAG: signal recognition particle-docking protein FtsY [Timaviella obliquedivisa GSE-PSE-MK23-08B]|jgi:fused signal recognition particle receptor|nr:signal recognition particle-docking protein FtsY [Timaviella obliquedivisa GSE-PSE-MK23-08B]